MACRVFDSQQQGTQTRSFRGRALRPGAGFGLSPSVKRMLVATLVIVGGLVLVFTTASFWINWLWFDSMAYRSVLLRRYAAVALSFLVIGGLAALVFYVNVSLALRNTRGEETGTAGAISRWSRRILRALIVGASLVILIIAGTVAAQNWEQIMLAVSGRSFGIDDPTFNRDVGFYMFTLPALSGLQSGLVWLVGITTIAVAVIYAVRLGVRFRSWGDVPWAALRHLSGLIAAILLLLAFGYWLRNFDLVFSQRGVVIGPGYTDVNIVRPLNWLMALSSAAAAILILSGRVLRTPKYLIAVLGGWFLLAVLVTPTLPELVQRTIVNPNEFQREQEYIERNLEMTRAAFGLGDVEVQELTGQESIDPSSLSLDEPPLRNVRIWDYRVVQPIYEQLQSFVPYYTFDDIDVDRYEIVGVPTQVLVGTRELNVDGLPENAQTWTNRHLAYTHGYAAVVSPVSEVSSDGWPEFLVRQIPPEGPEELAITRPEIYHGEADLDWVIVKTDQGEFSGLVESDDDAVPGFQGDAYGGIALGKPFTRALAALSLGDRNVFLSSQLTGDSELLLWRSVVDRAEHIAPFLAYDPDPYLVIAGGRLVWVIDAYTASDNFPSAKRYDGINYLRNSVKVTVDAYTGDTTFYRTALADPIADAYGRIYPDLFADVSETPPHIAEHFRYPEMQFTMQARVWSEYHVESARSFYDGDDVWSIAEESVGGDLRPMEPFFVTQRLPNEAETVFALTVPFTPAGQQARQNMTAWMAGTAAADGDTDLRLYRFPRQVTVYGPRQIEAQINQSPEISEQITLWNQSGSEVIQGNLLVIPVDNAMLYVQPMYLQASESSAAAPRLARVIVAANNQVVMAPTLGEAIDSLRVPEDNVVEAGDASAVVAEIEADVGPQAPTQPSVSLADLAGMSEDRLLDEAVAAFDRGQEALANGDWSAYGEEQTRLEAILDLLAGEASPPATPEAGP
ncbi:MAG TPA: UPF0182 family protein [Thermomicrobiales bacterium]|nr:UPF0182 family protein [Thermomicrobiales bacterium]